MNELFPELEPFNTGYLKVTNLHRLYYEESGNPKGQPVLFLHGGPGAGVTPAYRRFFDPAFYRIILFDQRGAGQSQPYASLIENTTPNLVEDIERLRAHLGVSRWVVFGGSWGSTLALAYAIQHPAPVLGMILRGIYLGTRWENNWLFQEGASNFFPDAWQNYLAPIPPDERSDLIHAYYKRLTSPDVNARLEAAAAWSAWETAVSRLIPDPKSSFLPEGPNAGLAISRIECHFFVNSLFFPSDDYLLTHAHALSHIPCRIVHGRYDLICPIRSAFALHARLPQSELRVVPDAGHSSLEPGTTRELIKATSDYKHLYS